LPVQETSNFPFSIVKPGTAPLIRKLKFDHKPTFVVLSFYWPKLVYGISVRVDGGAATSTESRKLRRVCVIDFSFDDPETSEFLGRRILKRYIGKSQGYVQSHLVCPSALSPDGSELFLPLITPKGAFLAILDMTSTKCKMKGRYETDVENLTAVAASGCKIAMMHYPPLLSDLSVVTVNDRRLKGMVQLFWVNSSSHSGSDPFSPLSKCA
jgi:hypothetical protein